MAKPSRRRGRQQAGRRHPQSTQPFSAPAAEPSGRYVVCIDGAEDARFDALGEAQDRAKWLGMKEPARRIEIQDVFPAHDGDPMIWTLRGVAWEVTRRHAVAA